MLSNGDNLPLFVNLCALSFVLTNIMSQEIIDNVGIENQTSSEPEVDYFLTLSKRNFSLCNRCTARNYIVCCNYNGLCCHILQRCPATSVIRCSRSCSGGCPNGQWCCPSKKRHPCCADPLNITSTTPTDESSSGIIITSTETVTAVSVMPTLTATTIDLPVASSSSESTTESTTIGSISMNPTTSTTNTPTSAASELLTTVLSDSTSTTTFESSSETTISSEATTFTSITSTTFTSNPTSTSGTDADTTSASITSTTAEGTSLVTSTSGPTSTVGEIENAPDTVIVVLPTRRSTPVTESTTFSAVNNEQMDDTLETPPKSLESDHQYERNYFQ